MPIEHISDTARWVATYRAWESRRADAIFRDPYAAKLAGERGEQIVRGIKRGKQFAWAMIVRTAVIDELIQRHIDQIDTIVNLAAGLDARPYRLQLPESLHWIEIDLPDILHYKEEILKQEKPVCKIDRIRIDLADVSARRKVFAEIQSTSKQVLVITEGLLVYLTEEQVAGLAGDLYAQTNFQYWLTDISTPPLLRMLQRLHRDWLERTGIGMHFAPEDGPDYFRRYGWQPEEFRIMSLEAKRLKREMPNAWMWALISLFISKKKREGFFKNGMLLLKRS